MLQWFYEVDHIRLSYGLKYNGVELEKLSPGTKGIVLLILYLGIDVDDTRPLIVDQPDENLDNESIYELLTTYFKSAKTRRQIVLITHNPNLVVNGDSEQSLSPQPNDGQMVFHTSPITLVRLKTRRRMEVASASRCAESSKEGQTPFANASGDIPSPRLAKP
jgi:ABC-type cobalamin/Fe3+-siderophores transport system ATPase subunit